MPKGILFLTAAFLLGMGAAGFGQTGPTLKRLTAFDLPGPAGKRFDYLTIDEDDQYLISAHLAAGQTYVIDLRTNRVLAVVTDTPGAEGVEYDVGESQLLETAAREDAIPFDAPRLPEVKLNHRGVRCSFEAIIEDYHLQAPGLARLALIVRAADIKGWLFPLPW